jgi:hypothetical protein
MVGLGLLMTPLPTPLGELLAASGLAVLATEYPEAKELKDRIENSAKQHFDTARDKIIERIVETRESFEQEEKQKEESSILLVEVVTLDEANPSDNHGFMNPMDCNQSLPKQQSLESAKRYFKRRTVSFLTETVLPLLQPKEAYEDDDGNASHKSHTLDSEAVAASATTSGNNEMHHPSISPETNHSSVNESPVQESSATGTSSSSTL